MVEQKLSAPVDKVYALLTDSKWLEARCPALGELAASCMTKRTPGVVVTMKRRVRRELNAIISKVLNPDSDIEIEERWTGDAKRRSGTLKLHIVGKPITVTGNFSLVPEGNGGVYRIQHKAKVSVPLIGGIVEKFVIDQTEQGCADELEYLADRLKTHR
jgi:hypothetical protein